MLTYITLINQSKKKDEGKRNISKLKKKKLGADVWRCSSAECLPSMHEVPGSIPGTKQTGGGGGIHFFEGGGRRLRPAWVMQDCEITTKLPP